MNKTPNPGKQPKNESSKEAGRSAVSAYVISHNEEANIEKCLQSLSFCDEVLLVDSFSTDRTVELAKSCGAKVIQREWPGYRDQKQFALDSAKYDWALNLDADERVSGELKDSILQMLREDFQQNGSVSVENEVNAYSLNRVVYHLGRWWRRGGWQNEYRLRLFRKPSAKWVGRNVHEKVHVLGKTKRLQGELFHFTYKNLDDQFNRLQRYSTLLAEEDFQSGKRASLFSLLLNPLYASFKFYFMKSGYREGKAGLIVAIAEGYYTFMKYAKLWELEFAQDQEKRSAE